MTKNALSVGDPAPDFSLPNQDGDEVSLASLRGHSVIVFFYPKAMTPGCTTEACDFRDRVEPLQRAGYTVLGISRDDLGALQKFRERDALPYDLLSDPDHGVHAAYGAWGEKKNYGKTVTGVIRSTFVIDADGRIAHALYNVKATGHVARVATLIGLNGD